MIVRERARKLLRRRYDILFPVVELPRPEALPGDRQYGEHAEWRLDFVNMEAVFDSSFDLFFSKELAKIARGTDGRWYYRLVMVRSSSPGSESIESSEEQAARMTLAPVASHRAALIVARASHWRPFPNVVNSQVQDAYTRVVGFFGEHPGLAPRDRLRDPLSFASLSFDPLALRGEDEVWAARHRYDAEEVTADAAKLQEIEDRHERLGRERDEEALVERYVEDAH